MEKRTIRFLMSSLLFTVAFCIIVFVIMIRHMQAQNEISMNEVCQLYMSEMSYQIEAHFRSVIDLRFDMVGGIMRRYSPEKATAYDDELIQELTVAGQIRNFEYLALYGEDGESDIIYGEPLEIIEREEFYDSLANGENKIVSGRTADGDVMLLFGVNAEYPMKDGKKSLALVAGLPIEYINYAMTLEDNNSLAYSHIIREDGSFVLKSLNNGAENYYEWLLSDEVMAEQPSEKIVEQLKEAMAQGGEYSTILSVDDKRRNIYCVGLQKTEWILVTVMPYGALDQAVYVMGRNHLRDAIICCVLILVVLLCFYLMYFRMSLRRMKQLNEAQKEAVKANRAKSDFLSNMSHDIRTPMNGIVGMTAIAAANMDKPDIVQDCLKKITLSSKHLLGLINDVLDMSKIESGKLTLSIEEISLRETVESIVNITMPHIKEKQQAFDVFIDNIRCEHVFCDGVRLNQVLINLLSNAVKFTPQGGSVYIMLSQEDSPWGEDYVRNHITVKDTGIGMSQEFITYIFDAFAREDNKRVSRTEGTGLGMAITKHIIDEMHGTIEVKSEQNKGTEFHVVLDLEKATVKEEDMMLPDWEVLVADDDEQMCKGAAHNLQEIGVRAEWALDGAAAIDMAAHRHEAGQDYQVIMLDWKMPDMSGIETAKKIRERIGDAIPILLVSAYDWSDIEQEARAAGITGFISKPLFKSTLFHGLSNLMGVEQEVAEVSAETYFDAHSKRVLVAEDYDMNWEILEALLPNYNFQIERAENGKICVEKFCASEPHFYDGILMDLRMPVMDGYEATAQIRALDREDKDIPIIAMTADAFSEDVKRCLEYGMNAHVAKPINMKELLNVLKKFL